MIFHIAVCSPDPVLRGRVQRHCMEYYARRADACIVEQLESTAALLQQEEAGSRYELYLIELPAANPCSGLQAAAELRRRGVRAPLAFLAHTTAYAYEAFRVDAMQYLHIPFRPEQLTALLDRATEPEYGPVIPVTTAMGLRALPFADIEYLECTHHVVHYHLASGEDVASLSLRVPFSEVAKPLLADARFLQPHRSYVVNLAAAAQLSSGELWMRSGARVPIPRGREPAVRAAFRACPSGQARRGNPCPPSSGGSWGSPPPGCAGPRRCRGASCWMGPPSLPTRWPGRARSSQWTWGMLPAASRLPPFPAR